MTQSLSASLRFSLRVHYLILSTHVRNFKMTCYYVASNLPAQLPAQFSAEQAAGADIADNAEFKSVSIS